MSAKYGDSFNAMAVVTLELQLSQGKVLPGN